CVCTDAVPLHPNLVFLSSAQRPAAQSFKKHLRSFSPAPPLRTRSPARTTAPNPRFSLSAAFLALPARGPDFQRASTHRCMFPETPNHFLSPQTAPSAPPLPPPTLSAISPRRKASQRFARAAQVCGHALKVSALLRVRRSP